MSKKFPEDFNKKELKMKVSELLDELDDDVLKSREEKENIVFQIQLGRTHLQYLQSQEMNSDLKDIIKNNKITSRISYFLSILTLIVALLSLYNNYKFSLGQDEKKKSENEVRMLIKEMMGTNELLRKYIEIHEKNSLAIKNEE